VLDTPPPDLLLTGKGEEQRRIRGSIREIEDKAEQDGTSYSVVQGLTFDGVPIDGASGSERSCHGYPTAPLSKMISDPTISALRSEPKGCATF